MRTLDILRRLVSRRQHAYQRTFKGPLAESVLADLMRFCRAHDSTFHPDPRLAANLDGRREVWLRIQQHLRLSPEELYRIALRDAEQAEARAQRYQREVDDDDDTG